MQQQIWEKDRSANQQNLLLGTDEKRTKDREQKSERNRSSIHNKQKTTGQR